MASMNVLRLIRIAWIALTRNKLRTSLAVLGVAIGVGAVVSMVAVGEGASTQVARSAATLGANLIWVEEGSATRGGVRTGSKGTRRLLVSDAFAIRDEIPFITNVSPLVDKRVQIIHGNQNWYGQVRGCSPEYLAVREWVVAQGEPFSEDDVRGDRNVCLLGATTRDKLFGADDAVNAIIRVQHMPIRVLGVLGVKGASVTGGDQDDTILMPYTTVQKKLMNQPWLDDIQCSAVSAAVLVEAERQITALMRERHHIEPGMPDDFNLRHPVEIADAVAKSAKDMEMLLASIAAISLLVGGIGIMNIMLVSVTERTREIGIRMSVGARGADIQRQFLAEALFVSLVGGLVGILIGVTASWAITYFLKWAVRMSPNAVLLAFGFAATVGVFFGYYPASKAARLDPILALRHEA
jgi:putative ABC transport system permease protein